MGTSDPAAGYFMNDETAKLTRREAIQRVAASAATLSILNQWTFGAGPAVAHPYGKDPLLNKLYPPGAFWPLTFTNQQKASAQVLADLIIPADDKSPAASQVGAVEFVDEWISAPYEDQQTDRREVLAGLAWLDEEAEKRFSKRFAQLSVAQQSAIADDICHLGKSKPEFEQAERFFAKFRNLVAGAFYATQKGWKDIGYVGNVPTVIFGGPPKPVLEKLGLV